MTEQDLFKIMYRSEVCSPLANSRHFRSPARVVPIKYTEMIQASRHGINGMMPHR